MRGVQRFLVAVTTAVLVASVLLPAQQGTLTPADQQRRIALEQRAPGHRRRRAQRDDADARRRAAGHRHLPAEGRRRESPHRLRRARPTTSTSGTCSNGVPADMTHARSTAVKRGYAYVVQNERGHFFSEGNYDILGPPITDGYDALDVDDERSRGRTARSARPAARRPPSGRWRSPRRAIPAYAAMNVAGLRRRRRPGRPLLRAGQLVSRRRGADALHRLALRRAEPGAADVPARTRRRRT